MKETPTLPSAAPRRFFPQAGAGTPVTSDDVPIRPRHYLHWRSDSLQPSSRPAGSCERRYGVKKPSPFWRHRRVFFALSTLAAAVAAYVILEVRR
jgi:hypothetical protein